MAVLPFPGETPHGESDLPDRPGLEADRVGVYFKGCVQNKELLAAGASDE